MSVENECHWPDTMHTPIIPALRRQPERTQIQGHTQLIGIQGPNSYTRYKGAQDNPKYSE